MIHQLLRNTLASALLALLTVTATAQAWPARPIRLVVPYAAGGGADFVARVYGKSLSDALGQAVVVENRPGANGNVGADVVAKAAPDGYTILLSSVSTLSANVSLYPKMPFDILRDFAPIGVVSSQPNILVVPSSLPVQNVRELLELTKAKPGALTYGSAGVGSGPHLSGELFKIVTGAQILHVPYTGAGPATADLLGGHISLMFNNLPPSLPLVASGKLRALAVTGSGRSPAAPEIPTMAEAGYPGVEMTIINALFAPASTPPAIIDRLNAEVAKVAANAEVQRRLIAEGNEAQTSTPAQLTQMLKDDMAKWAAVVAKARIKVE